jgi:protein phosphatase/serine/threonine-protein phosphatase Stp1
MSNAGPLDSSVLSAGRFRSSATTDPSAARTRNEDSYVNRPDLGIWVVADGAGGHQSGDVAARLVTDAIGTVPGGLGTTELLAEVRLRIAQAHESLRAEGGRRGGDAILATTLVILLGHRNRYTCLWIGDSRGYLLRDGRFTRLTRDHSVVQELVDQGVISDAEAYAHPRANVITRAVGAGEVSVQIDNVSGRLKAGDRFLLCSDGLSKSLDEDEIARLLASAAPQAPALVSAALEAGADDNVTAVAVEVLA